MSQLLSEKKSGKWEEVGRLIVRSPFNDREVRRGTAQLRDFLSQRLSPEQLLSGEGFRSARKILSALSGQSLVVRKTTGQVAGFALPRPETIVASLRRGLSWIRDQGANRSDYAASCALQALLVHPLADGNGRLFRLILVNEFFSTDIQASGMDRMFAVLYEFNGASFLNSLALACSGNFGSFSSLWSRARSAI